MKYIYFLLIFGLALASGQTNPAPAAKQLTPFATQMIANEKALTDAVKSRDVEYLKRTFADDYVEAGSDGQLHDRGEVLGDAYETQLKEYTPYNIEVVALNDSSAVVTYDVIVGMVRYDEEIPRYQRISSVWVKQGEQWRLKFQQSTPHVF